MASQQGSATFSVVAKDAASSVLKSVGKEMGRLGKTGGAIFKGLAAGFAVISAAIGTAIGLLTKFAKTAIQSAIEDDAQQQTLIATLKARGLTTEQATKRTEALIKAGQELAFTDTETRKAFEVASAFSKKYSHQQKILAAAQNLARAKGIDLATATKLVGKAYAGNTSALSRYGIQLQKGEKGIKAVGDANKQVAGAAKAYAETFSGQFVKVKDSISETVEAIGYAIGGGTGLPVFTRLLKGIQPALAGVTGDITKALPDITKFTNMLVTKFLANLPSYIATAKRDLPILIDKAKAFITTTANLGAKIAGFLGPEGIITTGIAAVGVKFGGLAGGIGATFATQFIKMGIDPITASIIGTLGGAVSAGLVQGLVSTAVSAAVKAFLGLFKSVPLSVAPTSVPAGVPAGAAPAVASGIGSTVLGVSVAAIAGVAAAAMATAGVVLAAKGLYDAIYTPAEQEKNMMDNYAKLQARIKSEGLAAVTSSAGGVYGSNVGGGSSDYLNRAISNGVVNGFKIAPPQPPIDLTNRLTLTLDGKVVASSISKYLAVPVRTTTPTRSYPRGR
jgi:hypothetical protein